MTTGEALKRFRRDFKLKQGSVADRIGMLQQGYYQYESDRVKMPVDVLVKIADAYDVSTDYLLGRSDNPKTSEISDADKKLLEVAKAFRGVLQSPTAINER